MKTSTKQRLAIGSGILATLVVVVGVVASRTPATHHPTQVSALGTSSTTAALLAVLDQPGTITVQTVTAADWAIGRAGLINLDHPTAKAAGLVDGEEAIVVDFHALRHPQHGLFIVDSGVEHRFVDDVDHATVNGLMRVYLGDTFKPLVTLRSWLATQPPLQGVLLTHLHLDHVLGLADVPAEAGVYVGPHEAEATSWQHALTSGSVDRALAGKAPLSTWTFAKTAAVAPFDGVVDVFGDGMLWALWLPGHTAGTTAYLARTPSGPVLFTGDISHTRWGWEHDVEPGWFSGDPAQSAASFRALRAFVTAHPGIDVRVGHQH
ncbi:MAG TPA: MBL fold metallo-hydrolase [Myxococcota bacterium]